MSKVINLLIMLGISSIAALFLSSCVHSNKGSKGSEGSDPVVSDKCSDAVESALAKQSALFSCLKMIRSGEIQGASCEKIQRAYISACSAAGILSAGCTPNFDSLANKYSSSLVDQLPEMRPIESQLGNIYKTTFEKQVGKDFVMSPSEFRNLCAQ